MCPSPTPPILVHGNLHMKETIDQQAMPNRHQQPQHETNWLPNICRALDIMVPGYALAVGLVASFCFARTRCRMMQLPWGWSAVPSKHSKWRQILSPTSPFLEIQVRRTSAALPCALSGSRMLQRRAQRRESPHRVYVCIMYQTKTGPPTFM